MQRDMRPLENRSRPHREVQLASVAAVETALTDAYAVPLAARRADRAIRPQTALKILSGALGVGVLLKELEGAYRASAHRGISCKEYALMVRGSQAYNPH